MNLLKLNCLFSYSFRFEVMRKCRVLDEMDKRLVEFNSEHFVKQWWADRRHEDLRACEESLWQMTLTSFFFPDDGTSVYLKEITNTLSGYLCSVFTRAPFFYPRKVCRPWWYRIGCQRSCECFLNVLVDLWLRLRYFRKSLFASLKQVARLEKKKVRSCWVVE